MKLRPLGDPISRRTAWRIAREQGRDALGGAEYLAMARLQADARITVDEAMALAADGIVPLASLDALTRAEQAVDPHRASSACGPFHRIPSDVC
ncbi:MAG: hypothetical protein ACP5VP_06425 [Candidatus Limnocylindrales bacterium]